MNMRDLSKREADGLIFIVNPKISGRRSKLHEITFMDTATHPFPLPLSMKKMPFLSWRTLVILAKSLFFFHFATIGKRKGKVDLTYLWSEKPFRGKT
jgi:hypothetical protein